MAKNQRRYNDEERASFVVMLEAAGYPNTPGALKRVAANAGVHENVLRRWWKGTSNPAPTTIVSRKKVDLSKAIRNELALIFDRMNVTRDEATYRDVTIAMGILVEKLQLIEGKPTQNVNLEMKTYQNFTPDDWDNETTES